ncbi:MAG: accessory factor UbiK family protein [Rickettsiales endosymbiont of Dermacentor nuttalli]
MNQKQNKTFFDDVAKLTGNLLSSLGNAKNETESFLQNKISSYFEKMNYVKREEFEVLKAMVLQIRQEQEKLSISCQSDSNSESD